VHLVKTLDILLIIFGLLYMILCFCLNVALIIKSFAKKKRLPRLEDAYCEAYWENMEIEEGVVTNTSKSKKTPLLPDI